MHYYLFQIYDNGKFSAYVKKWCIGSEVDIRGPFGSLEYKQNKVMLSAENCKYNKLMLIYTINKIMLSLKPSFNNAFS